jgi:hypothetical protein
VLNLPADMTELQRFVMWRRMIVHSREAKVPYLVSGGAADITDLSGLADFEDVVRILEKTGNRYAGIGYVFVKGDGMVGIDLDDVLDGTGVVKPWGRGVVERFSDTYMEISPSGTGLKIWAKGELPENLPGVKVGDGSIEMYDHARYFTVTGRAYRGSPLQIENHAADLLLLFNGLGAAGRRKDWPLQPLSGGRIPHGQQHSTLVSIAGTLRARRVCDEAILACLLAINAHQLERPASVEAISRIVRSTRPWAAR